MTQRQPVTCHDVRNSVAKAAQGQAPRCTNSNSKLLSQQQDLATTAYMGRLFSFDVPSAAFAVLLQVESPLMQLHGKAMASPMLWAPVIATILLHHSSNLPLSCFHDLLQAVHQQQLAEAFSPADLQWTLRYLHALAAAWPAASAHNQQDHQKAQPSSADRQWKVCSVTPRDHSIVCMPDMSSCGAKAPCVRLPCCASFRQQHICMLEVVGVPMLPYLQTQIRAGFLSSCKLCRCSMRVWPTQAHLRQPLPLHVHCASSAQHADPAACLPCKAVWDSLLSWLATTTSKTPATECAVAALATITSKNLTSSSLLYSDKLWHLPALQQLPVMESLVALIHAAFSRGEQRSI